MKGSLLMVYGATRRQQLLCGIDLDLASEKKNGLLHDPALAHCLTALLARGVAPRDAAALAQVRARFKRGQNAIGDSFRVRHDAVGNPE